MAKKKKKKSFATKSSKTPRKPVLSTRMKWIAAIKPFAIPAPVRSAISLLSKAGYEAYLVGGCVRDYLLDLPSKDFDIATDATPDQILELFPHALDVGRAFGVMKIPLPGETEKILEIATFREDMEYEDHRHPTSVRFAGAMEDAQRRDFTINALYFDPESKRILDCVGGLDDLKARVIRAIGDPRQRFEEDALRLLRAIRFSARFQFQIESATWTALCSQVKLLKRISSERIRDELTWIFQGKLPSVALKLLKDSNILLHLLPEGEKADSKWIDALAKDAPQRSVAIAWASVLTGLSAEETEKSLQSIGDRFRLSKHDAETIAALVRDLPRFNEVFQMRGSTLQRWIREPYFPDLLVLHRAEKLSSTGNMMAYELCRQLLETLNAEDAKGGKLVTGEDLIQLGLKPGPRFSEILRTVEDLALENKLRTKGEALEYVVRHFAE